MDVFGCSVCLGFVFYLLFGLFGFVCWVFGLASMIVVYVRGCVIVFCWTRCCEFDIGCFVRFVSCFALVAMGIG